MLALARRLIAFLTRASRDEPAHRWVCGCDSEFYSLDELYEHMATECPNRPGSPSRGAS